VAAQPERLWTEDELAQRWQVSRRTLRNWRWLGTGPKAIKVGRNALYPESEVIRWEKRQPRAGRA
jgi:predicted DNA-binding transcriptional regulator AlpA